MDKILTIHQIPGSIIDLIEETNDYCFLVTPYYKPWKLLERTLEKASGKEKRLVFIFRAHEVSDQILYKLNAKLGFDIYMVDRLHTKLYLNERRVIISSMNLFENSKDNNYEIGYTMDTMTTSRKFLKTVINEDILSLKPQLHLKGFYSKQIDDEERKKAIKNENKVAEPKTNYEAKHKAYMNGFCIRCRTSIRLNPSNPFCKDCYMIWSEYRNTEFEENYCHGCGRPINSSINKPLCYDCFKQSQYIRPANSYGF